MNTSHVLINLKSISRHYDSIKSMVSNDCQIGAVVKANAYGLGSQKISQYLHYNNKCNLFFVATVEEGIMLRYALQDDSIKICVLNGLVRHMETLFVDYSLIPVLNNSLQAKSWINYSRYFNRRFPAVIHFDTGMSRTGFNIDEYNEVKEDINDRLEVLFIMSHLACGDDKSNDKNDIQLRKFKDILNYLGNPKASLAASSGILLGKEYHFDIVRPGRLLYGFYDFKTDNQELKNSFSSVFNIYASIIDINHIVKGTSVGYGAEFIAPKDMTTITIGIGYADGIFRNLAKTTNNFCFFNDKKLPILGRISMDYMTLDASEIIDQIDEAQEATITLLNPPSYSVVDMAHNLNTIPHEITCRLGNRITREYIK